MGIGIAAIGALTTFKTTMDFKIAVIIGIVAIVGIVCQSILDYDKEKPNEENTIIDNSDNLAD